MTSRLLYELAGEDASLRFSPYCWRSRMALLHKGLEFTTLPWRFTEKEAIAFSGQGQVPVLVDGETVVFDSWAIAEHLERAHPDAPSLFGGAAGQAVTRFVNEFTDTVVNAGLSRLLVSDIYPLLHEKDRAYFRASRERRFGKPLEEVTANRDADLARFRQSLDPFRRTLAHQPFLGGSAPLYADYILFGSLQWARCVSALEVLANDDALLAWRERLLDAFDGHARRATRHHAP
ncbi:MAG: glutathione S-transferase family protein [Candidatus Accumulibacter sp.]|jgi:glutathione S-transferase|nr:glutathione S-transferase family protein [Accumulibacter sp.]